MYIFVFNKLWSDPLFALWCHVVVSLFLILAVLCILPKCICEWTYVWRAPINYSTLSLVFASPKGLTSHHSFLFQFGCYSHRTLWYIVFYRFIEIYKKSHFVTVGVHSEQCNSSSSVYWHYFDYVSTYCSKLVIGFLKPLFTNTDTSRFTWMSYDIPLNTRTYFPISSDPYPFLFVSVYCNSAPF